MRPELDWVVEGTLGAGVSAMKVSVWLALRMQMRFVNAARKGT